MSDTFDNLDAFDFNDVLDGAKRMKASLVTETLGTVTRDLYAASLAVGMIIEPRAGRPIPGSTVPFMDSVALGPIVPCGRFYVRQVLFIEQEGVQWIRPRFRSRIEAEDFERRMSLRAGARFGLLRDEDALHGLEGYLWALPTPRTPSVTPDDVRDVMEDYLSGHALDEDRLYDTTPHFEDTVACGEGSTWRRILTFTGAVEVTQDCITDTSREFERLAEASETGRPDHDFYFLRTGDEDCRFTAVTVRVPRSLGDGPVEVVGKIARNPFPFFADQISVLAAHLGRRIGPENYVMEGEAMGEDDIAMARLGL